MRCLLLLVLLTANLVSAELVLSGTWASAKIVPTAGGTVVLAMYDRNGTCCGGPAAALAGLGNLRTALRNRSGVQIIAIDITAGATAEQALAAATLHQVDDLPLLVDGDRATAKALAVETDMTMTYVVRGPDGTHEVVHSPNLVKKRLAD